MQQSCQRPYLKLAYRYLWIASKISITQPLILLCFQTGYNFYKSSQMYCLLVRVATLCCFIESSINDVTTFFLLFGHSLFCVTRSTEVCFTSVLSGRFITAIVVNPLERKLAKHTFFAVRSCKDIACQFIND